MVNIKVNGTSHQLDVEGDTPLLWVLREEIGLTGTKFGCGIAVCGACTVHVNGQAIRSCSATVASVDGADITTIEGLSVDSRHPVQQAWLAEEVPQCGYCQSGQIMATVAYLKSNPNPTDADIDANVTNICRCGTYERLRRAVHRAASLMKI
jgi:isoquinoline 1-oxidoreductase alpha subunit